MEKSRFRQVKRWFNRETFPCKECGTTDDGTNDSDIEWNEEKKKFVCRKCGHVFTEKNEYEEKLEVTEELTYGFYLRFLGCHFNPCDKCEDTIHKMFMRPNMNGFYIHTHDCITMEHVKKRWQFLLRFFSVGALTDDDVFRPCEKCQKKINKLFTEKELHIGNEVKPPVELWRKWEIKF